MRTSILVFRKHGSEAFELLAGPEVPIAEQEKDLREARLLNGVHPEIAEVQRWESEGTAAIILKFRKPEEVKLAAQKIKDDYAAHLEAQKPKKPAKATAKKTEPAKDKPEETKPETAQTETPPAPVAPVEEAAQAPQQDL